MTPAGTTTAAAGTTVTVIINGMPVAVPRGASLGSVLHARSRALRASPAGNPRGLFCGMGVCFECVVTIDGQPERACITPVHDGMIVEVQP
ncbi:(2Fe-2S)-binding protein [Pseudoxanthobacter sp.]|uniref:(2Fe-2S)-binding protein n=1 Tax=Pseudoxanthobacter sp. TaxID=1925742 RepID=UPI002FE15ACC